MLLFSAWKSSENLLRMALRVDVGIVGANAVKSVPAAFLLDSA
jgi:hypothetical protein